MSASQKQGVDVTSIFLLVVATVLYAGYNVLVKASGAAMPVSAQTTILATICLQIAALSTSSLFALYLWQRGVENYAIGTSALLWAISAGVCIGGAEIAYLYLFGGVGGLKPMPASLAIPVIVSGSIILALFASVLFFSEALGWRQFAGSALIIFGIALLSYDKGLF